MLKRLIEVALPLKEVSEQSAREKSIRHGHISTLHIWWARRPLAACRPVVFASLIPDPDDPECPESFRKLVGELLGAGDKKAEFRPKNGDGSALADTPRNRCLEFIKLLVRWENSNNPEYVGPARKLIAAAHTFLHPGGRGRSLRRGHHCQGRRRHPREHRGTGHSGMPDPTGNQPGHSDGLRRLHGYVAVRGEVGFAAGACVFTAGLEAGSVLA